jgi:cytochrome P450
MLGSLRNVSQLILYLPESSEVKTYRLKGEAMLAERQKFGSTKRDIFRHLLAEDSETGSKFTQGELNSNANLIIIAGTDTTTSVTGQLFRFLAKNPRVVKKLQNEVDEVLAAGKELKVETTRNIPYVSAVINEALRIASPLPSGVQACTPAAGLEIAGIHLPGNIQVQVPLMALMTDERYFAQAEEFIPERWTDRPELVKDRRAFSPFGHGVHSCVGKQLALNEMRLMVASVVGHFDIELGDSYDDEVFEREWMDFMAVRLGEEYLKFIDRKK